MWVVIVVSDKRGLLLLSVGDALGFVLLGLSRFVDLWRVLAL